LSAQRGSRQIELAEIGHIAIRDFLGSIYAQRRMKSTAGRKVATIRSFFKFLHQEGYIETNPAKLVSTPRREVRIPRVLQPDEVTALLEAPGDDSPLALRNHAILARLYATGMRVS